MSELSNSQLILVAEAELLIEMLKAEGKDYANIREACLNKFSSHWLVTDRRLRDQAIVVALIAYAMDDEQKESLKKLKELTGEIIV